jgi:hypothetical protein
VETQRVIEFTEAQRTMLENLPRHRVLFQFWRGELVVARPGRLGTVLVIDLEGKLYPYEWFMASLAQQH